MKNFHNPADVDAWLAHKGLFHMELGLDRMLNALQRICCLTAPVIQVLGTNGKGSTCTYLERLAREHGLTTGLYISPHFLSSKERILINGVEPDDAKWLEAANTVLALDQGLTYFEFLTLMAIHIFNQANCDVIILEAGLGGANDATSAIPAQIHCFTPIAMDHAHIIGPTIIDIVKDKAAAIRPDATVLSARQFPSILSCLSAECHSKNAQFSLARDCIYPTGMYGKTQQINAGLALDAWRSFAHGQAISPRPHLEAKAIASAFIPGRMQHINSASDHGELLLDGAHNPHAIHSLVRQLECIPDIIIFSALADKNWRDCLSLLLQLDRPIYITNLANERAESGITMAEYANRIVPDCAQMFNSLNEALRICRKEHKSALLTGSLYLLAEFYSLFPHYLYKD